MLYQCRARSIAAHQMSDFDHALTGRPRH